MHALVTGTAGFIGFHVANRLLKMGWKVTGIDNINDYYDTRLKYNRLAAAGIQTDDIHEGKAAVSTLFPDYRFWKINLQDRLRMDRLFESEGPFDVVINLAAQAGVRYSITNPHTYIDSNIVGFVNLLENCRHHKAGHLVYASSSSVYGLNQTIPFAENHTVDHPISLYAASKKSNELMAHTYSHLFGLPTTGLRFFTVYGPWGRPDMALFLFTRAIFEGKPIDVFNNGDMERDFTYIDDIVDGVVRVAQHPASPNTAWNAFHPDPSSSPAPYRIYNIGNSKPVKLLDFIEAIERHTGRKALKNMMPIQPGDVPKTYADVTRLSVEHGYHPSTSVDAGVGNFIEWYRQYYGV
ncbi:MAG: NAD-dependent epimerase [Chitinophagaceae bacterium]|nr:NAD-dependent epimerase [Chitinophagaceae bacterium]